MAVAGLSKKEKKERRKPPILGPQMDFVFWSGEDGLGVSFTLILCLFGLILAIAGTVLVMSFSP